MGLQKVAPFPLLRSGVVRPPVAMLSCHNIDPILIIGISVKTFI